jgi:hypothetical protein
MTKKETIEFMDRHYIVRKIEKYTKTIRNIDEISERGFYKIRCTLVPSEYKLDSKYIKTEKEFLYSYQIYDVEFQRKSPLSSKRIPQIVSK